MKVHKTCLSRTKSSSSTESTALLWTWAARPCSLARGLGAPPGRLIGRAASRSRLQASRVDWTVEGSGHDAGGGVAIGARRANFIRIFDAIVSGRLGECEGVSGLSCQTSCQLPDELDWSSSAYARRPRPIFPSSSCLPKWVISIELVSAKTYRPDPLDRLHSIP
jgi:hypothetical protein